MELNSSGTVTAFNIFAPDGLVARTASSTTTEYVFDQQGNVVNRTNTSGANVSVTQYDAYGTEHSAYGSPSDPFAYNGQWGYYLDRETGLYACQNRYYDPGIGRWLNRDPIGFGGGTNLYGYCADGPVGAADSAGLVWDWGEYWHDVGQVFVGEGQAVAGIVTGPYHIAKGFIDGGWRYPLAYPVVVQVGMISGAWDDLKGSWDGDPQSFGRVAGTGALMIAGLAAPEALTGYEFEGPFVGKSGHVTLLKVTRPGEQFNYSYRIDWGVIPDDEGVVKFARGRRLPHYHGRPGLRHWPWERKGNCDEP